MLMVAQFSYYVKLIVPMTVIFDKKNLFDVIKGIV